jgi:hypothetical protein
MFAFILKGIEVITQVASAAASVKAVHNAAKGVPRAVTAATAGDKPPVSNGDASKNEKAYEDRYRLRSTVRTFESRTGLKHPKHNEAYFQ